MISKLAKSTIELWLSEGLNPSVEDIIYLNALGLNVENGSDVFSFGAVPRCSFLKEYTLFEPTVEKLLWIDTARQFISDDFRSQLFFIAYALHTPVDELPKLTKLTNIIKAVKNFTNEVLIHFTQTLILSAVMYALDGNDWRTGEEYKDDQKKAFESIYEVPKEVYSVAQLLLAEALSYNLNDGVKHLTLKALERMIIVASLHNGADIIKNQHTENASKFYSACCKIHNRLILEAKKETNNEK